MIAITGATGQLGREVLTHLARLKPAQTRIIACTRHPASAQFSPGLVDVVRRADFADAASLAAAFAGIDTLLMISVEGEDNERIRLHQQAVEAARSAGVGRIVYTSFFDVDPVSPSEVARVHRTTEQCIAASGVAWTMLRNGPYIDNIALRIAEASQGDGIFRMASGQARLPFIARSDLAEAAAHALVDAAPGNRFYRLSGVELLDYAQLTALIGQVIGQPLSYQAIEDAEFAVQLEQEGLSQSLVQRRLAYSRAMRGGFMTALTDDFQRLVGRSPQAMADVLRQMRLLS
ncbi:NAD(P)H-binding protein [Herbaspirillum sp. NPDC087042]|uniref:NAD(P)H-binding protein n=1 Tax=Herbaspirillum sp. NPDC087042 TaxID=3364004 RepID=UPI0037F9B222